MSYQRAFSSNLGIECFFPFPIACRYTKHPTSPHPTLIFIGKCALSICSVGSLSALLLRAIAIAVAHPALSGNLHSAGEFGNSNGYGKLGNTILGAFWEQGQPEDVGSQKDPEENSGDGPEYSCGSGGKGGGGGSNWSGAVSPKTITDW